VHVGASGGIGSPEAVAAAFVLGADFVLTGSINQCTTEAGTSDAVKELLAGLEVQDVAPAPFADGFEIGLQATVVKRGGFFAARASKLQGLWRDHDGLGDLSPEDREHVESALLHRSLADALAVTREREDSARDAVHPPGPVAPGARDKQEAARAFRAYHHDGFAAALRGDPDRRVDWLVYCGPAMGAANRWLRGTALASWRERRVGDLAQRLMDEAAALIARRCAALSAGSER
jgi:trans-AT polyketide synthase, acyltransferase and oxidoreductase domains